MKIDEYIKNDLPLILAQSEMKLLMIFLLFCDIMRHKNHHKYID